MKRRREKAKGVVSGGGVCDIPAIDLHGHQSAVVSNGYPTLSCSLPHATKPSRVVVASEPELERRRERETFQYLS